jgi:poly(A) polymerase
VLFRSGLEPGPLVGKAWHMLLEARLDEGPMDRDRAIALLDAWAREQGLER